MEECLGGMIGWLQQRNRKREAGQILRMDAENEGRAMRKRRV